MIGRSGQADRRPPGAGERKKRPGPVSLLLLSLALAGLLSAGAKWFAASRPYVPAAPQAKVQCPRCGQLEVETSDGVRKLAPCRFALPGVGGWVVVRDLGDEPVSYQIECPGESPRAGTAVPGCPDRYRVVDRDQDGFGELEKETGSVLGGN